MAEPAFGHEPPTIAVGRVLSVGVILAITVIVLATVIYFVMGHWITPQRAIMVARAAAIPPAPRLQPHPNDDLAAQQAQKRTLLSTSEWLDPTHNFARIPIERAMSLYVTQQATTTKKAATATPPQDPAP